MFKRSIGPAAHATAAIGYVRLHGRNYRDWFREKATRNERYDYLYTPEELAPLGQPRSRDRRAASDP